MTTGRRTVNGVALSLLGLLANVFSLQLFEGFNYLFGSIPVFIALRTLGIRWAFVVAVVGSSWVNVLFWHPTAMLWLSLEPVFVGLMMRRTRIANMVVWDALYWPFVGNVILWIFFQYVFHVPVVGTVGAMLMFWLIGINNALIAELLLIVLPVKRWMGMADGRKTVSLKRLIFAVSTTLVWVPVFIVMAFNGQRISREGKETIRFNLEQVSTAAVRMLESDAPASLSGSDLRERLGWLDFGGVPYRFTITDGEGRIVSSTKDGVHPGTPYDPAGDGFRTPVTDAIDRVIPRPPVKVPRWRLAQLSFFMRRVDLPGGFELFVEIPFAPFQSRVLRQQFVALLVLVAMDVVILLFSIFFAGALSRAIIRLGDATRGLPEKIYRQETADWPDTAIREVALLADNFKETAQVLREKFKEIREANALLESRVHERTADLETANRELTAEMDHRKRLETERAQLEEKFRHIERMESLGRLAGGVAHDFNNLLTPILGYAELLKGSLGSDAFALKSVEAILNAAERASALTRQILAFSRKQVLEFEPVDLNATIRDFSSILKRIIGEDIELDLHLCEEPVRVVADAGQLNQVLMNLAVNARDAMPSGGRLIMETRMVEVDPLYASNVEDLRAGPYVLMSVSDTGSGMDPDTLQHIFEPFFTTKDLSKGTGLGLATVYGIVKQHSGGIHVYSEIGRGTAFKIYLPPTAEERRPEKVQPETADLSGNERILVVEDEEMVRNTVRATLEKTGYRVVAAGSAEAGLDLLRTEPEVIDLLLTDIVLPGKNGLELSEEARNLVPGLKVLFMSGYTADVLTNQTLMDERVAIIQKPFSAGELLTRLRAAFAG